jgi:hypothetical protein
MILRPFTATIFLALVFAQSGYASLRCPAAAISQSAGSSAAEITNLWNDLAAPATSGSDGPLGCPVDLMPVNDPASGWSGLVQRFQRGYILIGQGSSAGFEVAAVRGLGGWFVWWSASAGNQLMPVTLDDKGNPNILVSLAPSGGIQPAQNAAWNHGGFFRGTEVQADRLALWRCNASPCEHPPTISPATWGPVTPLVSSLDSWSRPFNVAASVDVKGITKPNVNHFPGNVTAALPDWLPCYTRNPDTDSSSPGEATFVFAMVMMRGTHSCPLTGETPPTVVDRWLAHFSFPSDQVPGTDNPDSPCQRHGDLDFMLLGLHHLLLEHQNQLGAASVANAQSILSPWGGTPRSDPYLTPNGTCFGFKVIETENHMLMQETSRYLINALRGANTSQNRDWILRFLQQLPRRDFYEFNSLPYTKLSLKALYSLNDYAPDQTVSTAASGVIDWLYAKEALFANFERDHRPYRRQPRSERYGDASWWGPATIASNSQAALEAGPFQHVHSDIDLELNNGNDDNGVAAFTSADKYPALGAADETFGSEFTDVADTKYKLPAAIRSWLQARFTDESTNRLTYVQGIHHSSPIADDPALFLQENHGAELVSGTRNWTIVAGGNMVSPGFPPAPPGVSWLAIGGGVVVGAIVGGVVIWLASLTGVGALLALIAMAIIGGASADFGSKAFAAKKQFDKLWEDQAGVMRETILIPTPVGLDRSQTVRFGQPVVNTPKSTLLPRLCVAEGFLCGFDLNMPSRPFPGPADQADCPLSVTLPAPLMAFRNQHIADLGCLTQTLGNTGGWSEWIFEYGVLAVGVGDQRVLELWIENGPKDRNRVVHLHWQVPGQPHNWYVVHHYNTDVSPTSGDAPGGDLQPLNISGDPNNSSTYFEWGDASDSLDNVHDSTWSFLVEGCDPTHFIWFRTGHKCRADILPKLTLNVAVPPKQAFSCAAQQSVPGPSPTESNSGQGLVLQVGGTCSSSPYGFFLYIWKKGCDSRCPPDTSRYGFAVVAPSAGWTFRDFQQMVEQSIAAWTSAHGHEFEPDETPSIDVPISPPVVASGFRPNGQQIWRATGPPTSHKVTFRWLASEREANIISDTGAPTVFGPLNSLPEGWPTALGHITAPDVPGGAGELLHSSGSGCFTLAGVPTPSNPNPTGLFVDLRNAGSPNITEPPSSTLAGLCP